MDDKNWIDKLAWIEIVDDKVLCVRSKGKELFYIPGGKREPGEEDAEALIREIREELRVELQPDSIQFLTRIQAQADSKPAGTEVLLTCYRASYRGVLQPAAEIAEMAWLGYADKQRCSLVVKMLFDQLYQDGQIC